MDSKAPGDNVTVSGGVLKVQWREDPDDGYEQELNPRMRGAAAGLAGELAVVLGRRPWVTPVVVVWGDCNGAPHVHDGVAWVHGGGFLLAVAACAGARTTEADLVRHAIQDQLTALREHNAPLFCRKTFSTAFLPPALAAHLGVRAGQPGTPAAWDAENAQCSRSFGRRGEFNHYSGLPRVAVLGVRVQDAADPQSGISGTAKATVRYELAGKSLVRTTTLVKYRGDWKNLFETD